jgi:excisionase family DNA binding protein
MTIANYEDLLPPKVLFNLREIENLALIKVSTIKKILSKGEIAYIRIGNKFHIARNELIRYLEANTFAVAS